MNTILLPTMHKMLVKAKMGVRDKDMKKRTKGIEIGKGAMYAMPFCGRYAPCGAAKRFDQAFSKFDAKQFDQTFSKFDAWCESMKGLQSAEMRGAMT